MYKRQVFTGTWCGVLRFLSRLEGLFSLRTGTAAPPAACPGADAGAVAGCWCVGELSEKFVFILVPLFSAEMNVRLFFRSGEMLVMVMVGLQGGYYSVWGRLHGEIRLNRESMPIPTPNQPQSQTQTTPQYRTIS